MPPIFCWAILSSSNPVNAYPSMAKFAPATPTSMNQPSPENPFPPPKPKVAKSSPAASTKKAPSKSLPKKWVAKPYYRKLWPAWNKPSAPNRKYNNSPIAYPVFSCPPLSSSPSLRPCSGPSSRSTVPPPSPSPHSSMYSSSPVLVHSDLPHPPPSPLASAKAPNKAFW